MDVLFHDDDTRTCTNRRCSAVSNPQQTHGKLPLPMVVRERVGVRVVRVQVRDGAEMLRGGVVSCSPHCTARSAVQVSQSALATTFG
jgi:hypothetical protein